MLAEVVKGRLAVRAMPRLADLLLDGDAAFELVLRAYRTHVFGADRDCLDLLIGGDVRIACQRCLSAVVCPIKIEARLLLVRSGQSWPEDEEMSDNYDAIEMNDDLKVIDVVEDEVLLALPISPRHADCRCPATSGESCGGGALPFAALSGLRK